MKRHHLLITLAKKILIHQEPLVEMAERWNPCNHILGYLFLICKEEVFNFICIENFPQKISQIFMKKILLLEMQFTIKEKMCVSQCV